MCSLIIIVTTVVVLVLGLLSLGLAIYGGTVASSIMERLRAGEGYNIAVEQVYYLLGMISMVVLTARILAVPIFFWMIQSLVPYCPGAMCAYGVVNVGAPYSFVALGLKMLLPFAYGLWLVVEIANRKHPRLPFVLPLARSFLFLLLPVVIVDSTVDVLLIASIVPVYAPCCSSVYDVDPPFSPSAILGPGAGLIIMIAAIALALLLSAAQWFRVEAQRGRILLTLFAAFVGLLYLVALHDTYAPLVLGLSTHHCPYCLFQEFPDTAVFSTFLWIGIAATGWRTSLEMVWVRRGLACADIEGITGVLRKAASVTLLFSMVSMISHILIAL